MSLTCHARVPLVAALGLLAMAGCAVGPDFKGPAAPDVGDYTAPAFSATVAAPKVTAGEAQRLRKGGDIAADWWTLFHSKPLNELIERALKNNHDLKA
ncbi:MAG: histidine kinase, partial [Gammaproteobacteria bacterium]